ncbi:anti-sigma factor antagonist [Herbidospora cretacea]|uniref:anti-sigma factor antagonist n=1 Tax=Herbidospora cretacea TaxID=28444 RepID=UPI0007733F04|nr:anti-sigma factor antagonist [Herbidospora cretacea]
MLDEVPVNLPGAWPITDDVGAMRDRVDAFASGAGLAGPRLHDLVFAANEAVVNVLEHGGGHGTVRIWQEDGQIVVEVTDLAGRLTPAHLSPSRPSLDGRRGFGLWLMSEVCDRLTIEQGEGGSRVEMRMNLNEGDEIKPRGDAQQRLGVAVTHRAAGPLVSVTGDLDATTSPQLHAVVNDLLTSGRPFIAADLSGVGFCDSSGLRVLLVSTIAARELGGLLVLSGVSAPIDRLLRLTGSLTVLAVRDNAEEALNLLSEHRAGS